MSLVELQILTAIAAGGLLVLGLLAFAVKRALGLVKPAPNPEDVHH